MPTIDFWSIVDSTANGVGVDRKTQVDRICNILKDISLSEIAEFKIQLNNKIKSGCTFGLMVAAFVVYSRLSDDLFLNFRSWVILHGKDVFESVLLNPDIIVKLVKKREVDRINEAGFFDLPLKLWLDKGGGAVAFARQVGIFKDRKIKTNWPADVAAFEERYPVLFKAFWNAGRIKAFHE